MAGRMSGLGLRRGIAPGAVACLVLGAGACGGNGSSHEFSAAPGGGRAGLGEAGLSEGPLITIGAGGFAGAPAQVPCTPALLSDPVFFDQVFDSAHPARRELYSWTSDEQAAALRRDRVLFTETERPGLGPGYAFTVLQSLADNASPEQGQLAASLVTGFAKGRYGWPEPWATRMGWPGEVYGGNLLHIVLRPEAWLVVMHEGRLDVFDLDDQPVAIVDALAHPERLGAILYSKDGFDGGPSCGGTFANGANAYREYIVGNLNMVESWSLTTQAIHDRLSANIDQLTRFLTEIRSCPPTTNPDLWNLQVACDWVGSPPPTSLSEVSAYQLSLAIPSSNYLPIPARIAQIIDTLQADLFEPNPLVVTPGAP